MKLHEAIRFGCKLRPIKCRDTLFYGTDCACVLGAAYVGQRGDAEYLNSDVDQTDIINELLCMFPILSQKHTFIAGADDISSYMVYANDNCNWSREQIADWVKTIEEGEEANEPRDPS